MKHLFLVFCLFGLIYGQTYLTNGDSSYGYAYVSSPVCYALSANYGDTLTVEVSASEPVYLYVTSSCTTDSYQYLVNYPVADDVYTVTYQVNATSYQYFVVLATTYYTPFSILANTGSSNTISNNETYSGYAPSDSFIYYNFYSQYDSFDIYITGSATTFYLMQNQIPTSSSYNASFYAYSSYPQQNSLGPCASTYVMDTSGTWYIAVTSYYPDQPFTIQIVSPSSTSINAPTLYTGDNTVTLNGGYNYFQYNPYWTSYGLEISATSAYLYIYTAAYSSCVPSSWDYQVYLSNTTSWVYFPSGNQLIAIYSYYDDVSTTITLNQLDGSYSGVLPLTTSESYTVSTNDDTNMVFFSYTSYDGYPFSLNLNNVMNIYIKQGYLPTTSDYDYYYTDSYETIDPCSYVNYVEGSTFYIGITYYTSVTTTMTMWEDSYSSCYNTNSSFYTGGGLGLFIGLCVGSFILLGIVIFAIIHVVQRRRRTQRAYAPLLKKAPTTTPTTKVPTTNVVPTTPATNVVPLPNYTVPSAPPMYYTYVPMPIAANGNVHNGQPMLYPMPPPYMPPQGNLYPHPPPPYVAPPTAPAPKQ